MFNALQYKEELERAGFTAKQAEVSVRVLIDVMNENFATKQDLKDLGMSINARVDLISQDIKVSNQEVIATFQEVRATIRECEYRMTIKMGAMMVVTISTLGTLFKFLQAH